MSLSAPTASASQGDATAKQHAQLKTASDLQSQSVAPAGNHPLHAPIDGVAVVVAPHASGHRRRGSRPGVVKPRSRRRHQAPEDAASASSATAHATQEPSGRITLEPVCETSPNLITGAREAKVNSYARFWGGWSQRDLRTSSSQHTQSTRLLAPMIECPRLGPDLSARYMPLLVCLLQRRRSRSSNVLGEWCDGSRNPRNCAIPKIAIKGLGGLETRRGNKTAEAQGNLRKLEIVRLPTNNN